jgi:elongation factor P
MYADEEKMHLIDQKTLEEFECPLDIANAGKSALSLLNDQCSISVKFHGELPLLAKLPERATFEIQETSPAISASSSESKSAAFKPALLKDSDVMIQVPDFINIGEKIVVDLNELKYIQRAK